MAWCSVPPTATRKRQHKDMEQLAKSTYARVQGMRSLDVKLPRSVVQVIESYAERSVDAKEVFRICETHLVFAITAADI